MGIEDITELFFNDGKCYIIPRYTKNRKGKPRPLMRDVDAERSGRGILNYNTKGDAPLRSIRELVSEMNSLPPKPFAFRLGNASPVKDYMTEVEIEFYRIKKIGEEYDPFRPRGIMEFLWRLKEKYFPQEKN